jgi:transcription elongation factor Elf1
MNIIDLCPNCGTETLSLLSTTNELKYHCDRCDQRFTERAIYISDMYYRNIKGTK